MSIHGLQRRARNVGSGAQRRIKINYYSVASRKDKFTMLTIPSIIAHRGASWDAPENTLAAFLLAWMEGADGIEADIQMTKDGEFVCVHDESLERTTGKSKLVGNSTLEEVRALDAGKWKRALYRGQKVPTLADVLSTVPVHGQVFIELKGGVEMIPGVRKQLKESKVVPANVRIASFNVETLMAAAEQMPEYPRLLLCKRTTNDGVWEPSLHILEATMRMVNAAGLYIDGVSLAGEPEIAKKVRAAGKELHVWTVNRAPAARIASAMGITSLTTDRPGWLRRRLLATPASSTEKPKAAGKPGRKPGRKPRLMML